jgi:hypothetical protein
MLNYYVILKHVILKNISENQSEERIHIPSNYPVRGIK